ncbi:hypothetical protein [Ferrovibrio terrae]|uniref:hypothetical protein n=1 Tax=Ferrovibrio terrae TaxID=2594003 RepID=UPI0031377D07
MEQIKNSSIPDTETVFSHLNRAFGLDAAMQPFLEHRSVLQRYDLAIDLAALEQACRAVVGTHRLRGFRNTADDVVGPAYGSLSLTFNPDIPGDPHAATLGSAHLRNGEYFYATARTQAQMPKLKGDYYDSYGFRALTPAAQHGALGDLMRGFTLPVIRSRLSVIPGNNPEAMKASYGWHRDESIFHNLRINIPVWTAPEYLLEIETVLSTPEPGSATAQRHHLRHGFAWSWDTNMPHRVFSTAMTAQSRCHLVVGLAPWFDYDPTLDTWSPNAHFGRVHPHDLIAEGLAHPLIRAGVRR